MPKHDLEAIKRIPIVDVAGRLGLDICSRSVSMTKAICPFHEEKHPSFTMYTKDNKYYCFGCNAQGDTINLVCGVLGLEFESAIKWLSGSYCVAPDGWDIKPLPSLQKAEPIINEEHRQVYKDIYDLGVTGSTYLEGRGISVETQEMNRVRSILGRGQYIGDTLKSKYSVSFLTDAGVLNEYESFIFKNHPILFFIGEYCASPAPVYITARYIGNPGQFPKYKHLRGIPLRYRYQTLGPTTYDPQAPIVICEGPLDALSAAEMGWHGCGVLGVNNWRKEWNVSFEDKRVVIAADNDAPGQEFYYIVKGEVLQYARTVDKFDLGGHKDLNCWLMAGGKDGYKEKDRHSPIPVEMAGE